MQSNLTAAGPSIEEQIWQLNFAGWGRLSHTVWRDPYGNYYRGPHGAWVEMQRRAAIAHYDGARTVEREDGADE